MGELKAARELLASQGALIERQDEMVKLERQISDGLRNLRNLDAAEKDELQKALAAKDRVIAAVEAENALLKKSKCGMWCKAKIGAAAIGVGYVLGRIF